MYIKSNNKNKKTSTRVKSQVALKVYFIESKTLDIARDLCDFHKLLVCHVNLIYRNLVNCQLQEQVHNCSKKEWKSLKLEKLTDATECARNGKCPFCWVFQNSQESKICDLLEQFSSVFF